MNTIKMTAAETRSLIEALEFAIQFKVNHIDGNTIHLDKDEAQQEEYYQDLKQAHDWRILKDRAKALSRGKKKR